MNVHMFGFVWLLLVYYSHESNVCQYKYIFVFTILKESGQNPFVLTPYKYFSVSKFNISIFPFFLLFWRKGKTIHGNNKVLKFNLDIYCHFNNFRRNWNKIH
jgi:hypothetical protein